LRENKFHASLYCADDGGGGAVSGDLSGGTGSAGIGWALGSGDGGVAGTSGVV